MRRSTPKNTRTLNRQKKKQNAIPPYNPEYDMQYGWSRKTGKPAGGHFWNPPEECIGPLRHTRFHNERWIDVGYCRHRCRQYRLCEAKYVKTNIPFKELDIPQNRRSFSKRRRS